MELAMVEWLVPVSIFWILSALYLGGAAIRFEGGGGPRQLAGLVIQLVLFLVAWAVLRAILRGVTGQIFAVVFATLLVTIALPFIARLGFRLAGVRISSDEDAGAAAG
jgi:hypothetical protein